MHSNICHSVKYLSIPYDVYRMERVNQRYYFFLEKSNRNIPTINTRVTFLQDFLEILK